MPDKKADFIVGSFERVKRLGGPHATKSRLLAQHGRDAKIAFLKTFPGIGAKYSRNMMMDAYHPDFRDSIALDSRIQGISGALGLSFSSYAEEEVFYLDVARQAGLNGWELDRLLFNFRADVQSALGVSAVLPARTERTTRPDGGCFPRRSAMISSTRATYTEANLQKLDDNGIPELVEDMKRQLASLHVQCSDDLGPVLPGNGELGFSVLMSDMKFCISIRANRQAKILVTRFSNVTLQKLGMSLDGPKGGKVSYWVIKELTGRFGTETVIRTLVRYKELLAK